MRNPLRMTVLAELPGVLARAFHCCHLERTACRAGESEPALIGKAIENAPPARMVGDNRVILHLIKVQAGLLAVEKIDEKPDPLDLDLALARIVLQRVALLSAVILHSPGLAHRSAQSHAELRSAWTISRPTAVCACPFRASASEGQ